MTDATLPCPHCGADIRADAKFCRHCGSSDEDGWRDGSIDETEDDEFDYDQFIEDEFSDPVVNRRLHPLWRWIAVIILLLFVLAYVL